MDANHLAKSEVKWYNDKTKLALSLLFWPACIYGIYKTTLIKKTTKLFIAGIFILPIVFGLFDILTLDASDIKGKSFASKDGWTEISFANTMLNTSPDFFNYGKTVFDDYGNPIQNIHKTGHYSTKGNIVTCWLDNDQIMMQFRCEIHFGEIVLYDSDNNAFIFDNPKGRLDRAFSK